MDQLANDYPDAILAPREPPCLSLYQPTHRSHPDKAQDPIRYRNLLKTLAGSLREKYAKREVGELLDPLHALADDVQFWNHARDGLAVLAAPGFFRAYKLQRPVPELAVVADSFHTKPLVRIMQSAERFHVLGLDRHRARLFEGNRDHLDEIPLAPEVPDSLEAALDRDYSRDRDIRTHGPIRDAGKMGRHGKSNVKQDAIRADTEQFFRIVDRGILEHHSRSAGLPLLLAALPEHHHLFREVSQNPHLLNAAIDVNPDDLSLDELRAHAWEIMLPHYLARLDGFIERFNAARSRGQATADLADAARAAAAGRIDVLLLDASLQLPGRMASDGAITLGKLDAPDTDDLLDDLGERVLRAGGEVVVVPPDRMPADSGLAAIYRF